MFCLGSRLAEERLVHVMRLRPEDVSIYTRRIRMASDLSKLRRNAFNRTSAFFGNARTSVVHDKFLPVLFLALRHYLKGKVPEDLVTLQDVLHPAHYLVTEIEPGWRPLSTCKFTHEEELESVLEQACCALAVAEAAVDFEHRLPIIDTVLIRPTRSTSVEYTLRGSLGRVSSAGLKIRLHGLHMARMKISKARWRETLSQNLRHTVVSLSVIKLLIFVARFSLIA
ncbi:serine/threonine-protein kinase haspin-like [Rhipicephalus microplus]|uniref:serine/threonine-protein kinase haspin-like n=1 Tax=Rhipicephalus microplus TaxID=6941 RepID=UPI003F6B9355